jgi:hypothetical protein
LLVSGARLRIAARALSTGRAAEDGEGDAQPPGALGRGVRHARGARTINERIERAFDKLMIFPVVEED